MVVVAVDISHMRPTSAMGYKKWNIEGFMLLAEARTEGRAESLRCRQNAMPVDQLLCVVFGQIFSEKS